MSNLPHTNSPHALTICFGARQGKRSERAGLKMIPICPFFAACFRKHKEQDQLDPAWRSRLGLIE